MATNEARAEAYQRIAHRARQLMRAAGEPSTASTLPTLLRRKPLTYSLPDPQPITGYLTTRGLPAALSEKLSQAYLRHAKGLKGADEERMRSSLACWIQSGHDYGRDSTAQLADIQAAYHESYAATLKQWTEALITRFQRHAATAKSAQARRAFQQPLGLQEKRSFKSVSANGD